jgi:DNA-binding CsgD family transcriptional regulator
VLGISIKTVEAQMGKALRILREELAPWLSSRRQDAE